MTIHSSHPFADSEPDPARQLRGRLGGAVTLWTSGGGTSTAGLTVSSLMVAGGSPPAVVALLDPDSDLFARLGESRTAVVHLLRWEDRPLADAFAGVTPAPGGPFRLASWQDTEWGPRMEGIATWAGVRLDTVMPVGWSQLVSCSIEVLEIGEDDDPLVHRRGRYRRH